MKQSDFDHFQPDGRHPWRKETVLRELYEKKKLSQREIANELGCSQRTVQNWMEKHRIEPRSLASARKEALIKYDAKNPAAFSTDVRGYEAWSATIDYKKYHVRVHRLLAVAEWGFEAVCGNVVHHKNEIKWDNRPSNIELMTLENHARTHSSKLSWVDKIAATEMYRNTDSYQYEIAEHFGVDDSNISRAIKEVEEAGTDDEPEFVTVRARAAGGRRLP